ncbi:MAG: B12-binding domain-containing radical SAM protein [Planctomycetota bacterium]|jgi:radical SAM superfamily enzyme YgiQ (UPF0313 family)
MNILLVYPECPDTFWSFKHALKIISRKATLPPLGLLTVAAMLPKDWQKKLVDMNVERLLDKDIQRADYVFISGMFIQKESAKRLVDRCKRLGARTVGGGPLFTSGYQYFDEVDHFVLNEAEITLPLFLEDLRRGRPKRIYTTDQWADMRNTPTPLWDLLDMKKYASMSIQYSRGCPFSCEFCDITMLFGNRIRTKSRDQILAELDSLYARGWREPVFVVDDNFIGNKRELKRHVLPAMIRWMEKRKHPFTLNTQVSINLADDEELMELMVRAGFDAVFVGIETPDEDSLAECNKLQNRNRDLVACVKKIQRFGMQVQGGFILGFDSEKPSVFETLIQFIQNSGIVSAMVGLLNAPRGTKLYNRLLKENRVLSDATGDNTDLSMNFIPRMKCEELIEGYKKVVRTIYSHKLYYERIATFLKNYKPLQIRAPQLSRHNIKTLIKSMWFLGLREKGRRYYWRLVLWSAFRRPQVLQLAVTFAIYGFHFRKIFENY